MTENCLHENYVTRERAGVEYHFCSTSALCLAWRNKHASLSDDSPPGPWLFSARPPKKKPAKPVDPPAETLIPDSEARVLQCVSIYRKLSRDDREFARVIIDAIDNHGGK